MVHYKWRDSRCKWVIDVIKQWGLLIYINLKQGVRVVGYLWKLDGEANR